VVKSDRTEQFLRSYLAFEEQLRAYLMNLLGNWNDMEDVFQETTLALWRSFDDYTPNTNFMSWARQIAFYRVLQFRAQKQRRGIPGSEEFLNAIHQTMLDRSDRQESRLQALSECLGKLNESDRKLVAMTYESNRPIKEVASVIGRPATGLYKAIERIRHALVLCVERALTREEQR
jgi:RNA polymerase sigma-70 factor (ECF subfamily)